MRPWAVMDNPFGVERRRTVRLTLRTEGLVAEPLETAYTLRSVLVGFPQTSNL